MGIPERNNRERLSNVPGSTISAEFLPSRGCEANPTWPTFESSRSQRKSRPKRFGSSRKRCGLRNSEKDFFLKKNKQIFSIGIFENFSFSLFSQISGWAKVMQRSKSIPSFVISFFPRALVLAVKVYAPIFCFSSLVFSFHRFVKSPEDSAFYLVSNNAFPFSSSNFSNFIFLSGQGNCEVNSVSCDLLHRWSFIDANLSIAWR